MLFLRMFFILLTCVNLAEPDDRKLSSSKRPASIVSGPQKLKKIQQFDLAGMVKPVAPAEQMCMSVAAFKRILNAESKCREALKLGKRGRFNKLEQLTWQV